MTDDLIERLRTEADLIHDNGITRKLPRHRVAALLREAAAALEAAREDAAEAKQNGYELGLLAGAQEAERLRGVIARYERKLDAALEAAREDAERWRQAFVDERARRYRADGMKIEQARIHAETDAEVAAIDQARGKGVSDEA